MEDFVITDWISTDSGVFNYLEITKLNLANVYLLYCDIIDTISIWQAEKLGLVQKETNISGEEARIKIAQITNLNRQIDILKASIKKETQFNKRVDINMELGKLKKKRVEVLG